LGAKFDANLSLFTTPATWKSMPVTVMALLYIKKNFVFLFLFFLAEDRANPRPANSPLPEH
jgi:hypothetical protein